MTSKTDRLPAEGMALLLFVCLAWGANWPVMKFALVEIDPLSFRALTIVAGALALMAMLRFHGRPLAIPREDLKPLLLAALLNVTGWHVATGFGISMMEAGRAAIIGFTMPAWAVLIGAVVLKERVSLPRIGGLALGIAGLAVLLAPDAERLARAPWGVVLMLVGAMCWGAGTVAQKAVRWRMDAMQLAAWQLAIGGIPAVAATALVGEPATLLHASGTTWLAVVYVGIVSMSLCNWAWFKIVEVFPPGISSIGLIATPVVGVFTAAAMLRERIGASEISALALVVAGLVLVMIVPSPGGRPANAAEAPGD